MRPDDETPPDDQGQEDQGHAGEHEVPPSTWAARKRAAGEESEAEAAGESEGSSGLTDDFDAIERELDAELELLGEGEGDEPADEAPASEEPEPEEDGPEEDEQPPEAAPEEADEAPDAEPEQAEEAEASAEAAPEDDGTEAGGETVEADTVTAADREQAQEAALAGLKARAGGKAWDTASGPAVAGAPVGAAPAEEPVADAGEAPRTRPLWARFLAATLTIVTSMAAATSISLLVYLTDFAEGLRDNGKYSKFADQFAAVDGGDPQNILIIGSDERLNLPGDRRSDTTILVRIDPDSDAISLLSIPRDLKVTIPNHGTDKFNAAYSFGGAKLTLRVVKQLTGIPIHHLVNINFTGFADAVNAIDCVYIDVDRRYYIPPESGIAEIDVEAGYQRLCGLKALQYVRFRHDDNDLVRSARQQDFLREARQQVPPWKLIEDRNELIDIFTDYTTSDIDDPLTLLELLKTLFAARNASLHEVRFPADLGDGSTGYVTAATNAIEDTVATFMNATGSPGPPEAGTSDGGDGGGGDGKSKRDGDKEKPEPEPQPEGPAMDDATGQGQQYARQISKVKTKGGEPMVEFPIFYPTRLVPGSTINSATRAFPIDGPGKDEYRGYKMVVQVPGSSFGNGLVTEYYGISGTDWEDPPILAHPSETREIDGREYDLFFDGDRLRLVSWHEKRGASYWVNNTLSQSLSEAQMLEIAKSMRQLD